MSEKSFKEQYERLEQIVDELSKEQKDIDQAIELFKEGIENYQSCNKKLEEAKLKVMKITEGNKEEEYEEIDG